MNGKNNSCVDPSTLSLTSPGIKFSIHTFDHLWFSTKNSFFVALEPPTNFLENIHPLLILITLLFVFSLYKKFLALVSITFETTIVKNVTKFVHNSSALYNNEYNFDHGCQLCN